MSILESILGSVLGGGSLNNSPLRSILASILSGEGGGLPGLGGLLQQLTQAGHGDVANSWVGNGENRPIDPSALGQVFGQDRVNQWAQQTGMAPNDLLHQLSQFLPKAVDTMTPEGKVPVAADASPFDGPGV